MDCKARLPFLKWPGGKQWLSKIISSNVPISYKTYYEPFLGGGAVFFELQPSNAVLSDINDELICLYTTMRDHPVELSQLLMNYQKKHSKEFYYSMRKKRCRKDINKAARLLYLNRTCYNGMYRVNKRGLFNVPIGTKSNIIYDVELFEDYSKLLENAELLSGDFEAIIDRTKENDLVFADPPYVMSQSGIFTKYNGRLFNWEDQKRLFNALSKAKKRGAYIVATNVCCDEIKEMYIGGNFYVYEVSRICTVAAKAEKRQSINELLISSFEMKGMEKNRCLE